MLKITCPTTVDVVRLSRFNVPTLHQEASNWRHCVFTRSLGMLVNAQTGCALWLELPDTHEMQFVSDPSQMGYNLMFIIVVDRTINQSWFHIVSLADSDRVSVIKLIQPINKNVGLEATFNGEVFRVESYALLFGYFDKVNVVAEVPLKLPLLTNDPSYWEVVC